VDRHLEASRLQQNTIEDKRWDRQAIAESKHNKTRSRKRLNTGQESEINEKVIILDGVAIDTPKDVSIHTIIERIAFYARHKRLSSTYKSTLRNGLLFMVGESAALTNTLVTRRSWRPDRSTCYITSLVILLCMCMMMAQTRQKSWNAKDKLTCMSLKPDGCNTLCGRHIMTRTAIDQSKSSNKISGDKNSTSLKRSMNWSHGRSNRKSREGDKATRRIIGRKKTVLRTVT